MREEDREGSRERGQKGEGGGEGGGGEEDGAKQQRHMHGVQYNSRIVQSFPCHMELQLQVSGRTQVPLFSHITLQMAGVYHTTCQHCNRHCLPT